jgi:hypothetical protein
MLSGNWTTVLTLSGQSAPVSVVLSSPADYCIALVAPTTPKPEWRRAGWLKQYAAIDGDRTLLLTNSIELGGEITQVFPLPQSEILFYPVQWLVSYSITIKIRQAS